jgi:hypothetical protein
MKDEIKEYLDVINKYIFKLENEVNLKQDPYLIYLFQETKNLIVKDPNIPEKFLIFYTDWLKEEYEYLLTNKSDLESSILILLSISEKIKKLSKSETKK